MGIRVSRGYSLAASIMVFFAGMMILTAASAFVALLVVSHQWIKSDFESQTWDAAILPVGYLLSMSAGQVMGYLGDYMRGEMRGVSGILVMRKIVFESIMGMFILQAIFFCMLAVMCKACDIPRSISITLVLLATVCIVPVWVITKKPYPEKERC